MEMKPGYKHTEVGVIPEEWECTAIGEIADICVGRDLYEDRFSTVGDSIYRFPVYSNTVTNEGLYGFYSTPEYEGDSLTVVGRGVGLGTAFAREGGYGAIGRLLVLLPRNRADAQFLATYINQRVSIFVETGGIPQLTGIQFSKYKVALPPLPEQRAIAGALSDVDGLLRGLNRLIAKKRDHKQAAMQQLLTGQTRLPGFAGSWSIKKIIALCQFENGVVTAGGELGYIEIGDVDVISKTYDVAQKEKLSVRGAVKVPGGTLLISTVRPTRGAITITSQDMHVSGAFCRLRIVNNFVFYLVCQERFLAHLGENSIGGTYPTCRDETILNYECLAPDDPNEQAAISAVLSDIDAELTALERRREKTRALKQAMMQELLTGKTRLVAAAGEPHARTTSP